MDSKKLIQTILIFMILISTIFLISCSSNQTDSEGLDDANSFERNEENKEEFDRMQKEELQDAQNQDLEESDEDLTEVVEEIDPSEIDYLFFTANVQDWVYPEQSYEEMMQVINLHEEYNLPIDIYLTDPIFQIYMNDYPDLIEKMKESDVVSISYHQRPPSPFYGFDTIGLAEMSFDEQYETSYDYETHAIDLETGLTIDSEGGYQYIKDTFGYAPLAFSGNYLATEASTKVYKEMGATFVVAKGGPQEAAAKEYGVEQRPETDEIRMWELWLDDFAIVQEDIDSSFTSEQDFMQIKFHDNNFHMDTAGFWVVYKNEDAGTYDLDRAYEEETYGEDQQAVIMENYEKTLEYVANLQAESGGYIQVVNLMQYADIMGFN